MTNAFLLQSSSYRGNIDLGHEYWFDLSGIRVIGILLYLYYLNKVLVTIIAKNELKGFLVFSRPQTIIF